MQKKLILNNQLLNVTIKRLCQQLIEDHQTFDGTVLLGLQPRGIFLAEKIQKTLLELANVDIPLGFLDITFHRDDFRRRDNPLKASYTDVPFLLEGKKVVLIDDVLFTGRSVRAALDAMTTFGRPEAVELLVLIDRKYTREFPIEAKFTGKQINSMLSQKVLVEWKDQGAEEDNVWLFTHQES